MFPRCTTALFGACSHDSLQLALLALVVRFSIIQVVDLAERANLDMDWFGPASFDTKQDREGGGEEKAK